jgi:hypothetical protein
MRTLLLVLGATTTVALQSCSLPTATAQIGYAQFAIDGDIGYQSGSAAVAQDVESAFGLGDEHSTPYVRAMLDTGVQVLSVSAFTLGDDGSGVLEANFGDSGLLTAGVPVRSELDMTSIKGTYAFEIALGPVSVAPGIAVNFVDLELEVRDEIGITTETLDLRAPIPMLFARGMVDLGPVSAVAELGYVKVDIEDVDTSFLDAELMLMVHPVPLVHFFAGYRRIELEGDGEVDGDAFDADLSISGWMVGGGIRF